MEILLEQLLRDTIPGISKSFYSCKKILLGTQMNIEYRI